MGKIFIIDVTNRDGVQTARIGLAKLEKTIINMMLNEMGVFQSELGFPFTKHEINYINANLELAGRHGHGDGSGRQRGEFLSLGGPIEPSEYVYGSPIHAPSQIATA